MTRPRVVLDTNVILSAILCGGNPGEYFAMASAGVIELCTSPFILEELSRVLKRKFRWPPSEIEEMIKWFRSFSTMVQPKSSIKAIKRKDSDNRILECALEAKAHFLVTGDKRDLLPLKEFHDVRIISPIEGLAILSL